jgi:predicted ABC-type ATPase
MPTRQSATVLSTDKYRKLVLRAKERGFEIRLIYVLLRSSDLNIERIKLRVAKGGHDVPANKVIERRARSLAQLPWFFEQADQAWLFDNSEYQSAIDRDKTQGRHRPR